MSTIYTDVPEQAMCTSPFSLQMALEQFEKIMPRVVLEIGVARGGTLYQWMSHTAPGATFVAVDVPCADYYEHEDRADVEAAWRRHAWKRGHTLSILTQDSTSPETVSMVARLCPSVDFLYIDGDHSYEGAKADWLNYGALVRPGGIVGFHDINCDWDDSTQLMRLWNEIRQTHQTAKYTAYKTDAGIGLVFL